MTTSDQRKIAIYRQAIALVKKGHGKGHVPKHAFDFDMNCLGCQAMIVVGFLEEAVALTEWSEKLKKKPQ